MTKPAIGGVLLGYDKPWLENPEYIKAAHRCTEAKEDFVPLKKQKWAEQIKDKGEKDAEM